MNNLLGGFWSDSVLCTTPLFMYSSIMYSTAVTRLQNVTHLALVHIIVAWLFEGFTLNLNDYSLPALSGKALEHDKILPERSTIILTEIKDCLFEWYHISFVSYILNKNIFANINKFSAATVFEKR